MFVQGLRKVNVVGRGSRSRFKLTLAALTALVAAALASGAAAWDGKDRDEHEIVLPVVASTIPNNGDVNPYGVEFVPKGFPSCGTLRPGDLLVSNFNASSGLQGSGTTIVKFSPDGTQSLFFQGTPPLGLTTALEVMKKGFVLVGNFPSPDGSCQSASPGSILVLDASGQLLTSISSPELNGPWDSTIDDRGDEATLFVSMPNTNSGTNAGLGTVLRFELKVKGGMVTFSKPTVVANGYFSRCDPVTFVAAPTGLVYDKERDILFVASTGDNAVYAVDDAAHRTSPANLGRLIYQDNTNLHGALAMVRGPFGHLFVSNNDGINPSTVQPSAIVEFTTRGVTGDGTFLRTFPVDFAPGAAFGLNFDKREDDTRFAYVNDNQNVVTIWTIERGGH